MNKIRVFYDVNDFDFFGDDPDTVEWRNEAMDLMEQYTQVDYQILTNRPEYVIGIVPSWWIYNWPAHVWIGTSVENQQQADEHIPPLLHIPAEARFLYLCPLLGPVDLRLEDCWIPEDCYPLEERLHQVVVGGESGPNARPMHLEWVIDIMKQCGEAGVPVFVKEMGSNTLYNGRPIKFEDKEGVDMSEWPPALRTMKFNVDEEGE